MLYLTRRTGEAVIINNAIEVRVVELKGKAVKLGFTFPAGASVLREEVFLQIKAENEAAAAAAVDSLRSIVHQTGGVHERGESPPGTASAAGDTAEGPPPGEPGAAASGGSDAARGATAGPSQSPQSKG